MGFTLNIFCSLLIAIFKVSFLGFDFVLHYTKFQLKEISCLQAMIGFTNTCVKYPNKGNFLEAYAPIIHFIF